MGFTKVIFICVIFMLYFIEGTFGIVNYCDQNTFLNNNTYLQLNKEATSSEFGISQRFKGLHCCAKGYRSIEWKKDGQPYPWSGSKSSLILYPESANQTIYTTSVSTSDTGNYTCVLRNDSFIISHTIRLQVFEKAPDNPQTTFVPEAYQEAEIGSTVRLFCEAFLGPITLPDTQYEAFWQKVGENETIENSVHIRQEKVAREDDVTLGVYLQINGVKKEDFGEYVCRISKPDTHVDMKVQLAEKLSADYIPLNPVPWKQIFIIAIIVCLFLLTVIVLNLRYGLLARVFIKDRFQPLEVNDGKQQDVLICYSQKDSELVLGVLLPHLEAKYNYKCAARELSSNVNNWHIEMNEPARKSRRVLCVLSPSCFNDNWEPTTVYQGLKQLKALEPPLSCLALKPLPSAKSQIKNDQGETLTSLLQTINIINWERNGDENQLWLAVRLQLPPRRYNHNDSNNDINIPPINNTRLNFNSHESLDNLV